MLEVLELGAALAVLPGIPAAGVFTRYIDYETFEASSNKDLLWDEGPANTGQRYTPIGGPKGLYFGEGLHVARCEFTGQHRAALVPHKSSVALHVDASIKLVRVLDLGDAGIRRQLITSLDELKREWRGVHLLPPFVWPPTWILGQAVFDCQRFDGIRFPSAAVDRHYNLLVLTERLGPGAEVRIESGRGGPPLARKTGTFLLKR
jgi:hypothetical protein